MSVSRICPLKEYQSLECKKEGILSRKLFGKISEMAGSWEKVLFPGTATPSNSKGQYLWLLAWVYFPLDKRTRTAFKGIKILILKGGEEIKLCRFRTSIQLGQEVGKE